MVKYELTDFGFNSFKLIPDFDSNYFVKVRCRRHAKEFCFVLFNDNLHVYVTYEEAQNIIQNLDKKEIRILLEVISTFHSWDSQRKYLCLFQFDNFRNLLSNFKETTKRIGLALYTKIMRDEFMTEESKTIYVNTLRKLESLNPEISIWRKKVEEIDIEEFNKKKELKLLSKTIGRK
jgi:hypothetical protein